MACVMVRIRVGIVLGFRLDYGGVRLRVRVGLQKG
jgi:hypothetical protein